MMVSRRVYRPGRSPRAGWMMAVAMGLLVLAPSSARAEEPATAMPFDRTAASAEADLQKSLQDLSSLRETIAVEKLPLSKKLGQREQQLSGLRSQMEELSRQLDSKTLGMGQLQKSIQVRQGEKKYLTNLLEEYIRNFESGVHIAELQRYEEQLEEGRKAADNDALTPMEVFQAQTGMVSLSLERLNDLPNGSSFAGSAVDVKDGSLKAVQFALVGPVVYYSAEDGSSAGIAEQKLGSLEPNMVAFLEPDYAAQVAAMVSEGRGVLPFDPSLGAARKIDATKETWIEHIKKGGPVMIPILLMALAAMVVGILKWLQLARVRMPSSRRLEALYAALRKGDAETSATSIMAMPGPTGEMLKAGFEHVGEPKELVEEVMFERMLETRLKLQSFLPFVAMSASAAPLLGLLGTVTGMINTFKLITVFGSGDAKTLSGGISEALITTEFGLIVAIPSLFLYAFLSRKSRRLIDKMEKTAVSFLNRLGKIQPVAGFNRGELAGDTDGVRSAAAGESRSSSLPPVTGGPAVAERS